MYNGIAEKRQSGERILVRKSTFEKLMSMYLNKTSINTFNNASLTAIENCA